MHPYLERLNKNFCKYENVGIKASWTLDFEKIFNDWITISNYIGQLSHLNTRELSRSCLLL